MNIFDNATARLLSALIAVAAAGFFGTEPQTEAQEIVQVELTSGRVLVAEVSPRTDAAHLWLIYRTRSCELLRSIPWGQVTAVEFRGQCGPAESAATAKGTRAGASMAKEALNLLFSPDGNSSTAASHVK